MGSEAAKKKSLHRKFAWPLKALMIDLQGEKVHVRCSSNYQERVRDHNVATVVPTLMGDQR
jgi:hypothetical protein